MHKKLSRPILKVNFLEKVLEKPELFSIGIGLGVTLSLIFFFLYVIVESSTSFGRYYHMAFQTDFLEDINPGTKIRFQGSLVVGDVSHIESNFKDHLVHARIKNSFLIPRHGSRVSIQTWGYMGQKFINIGVIQGAEKNIPYLEGDVIPMQPSNRLDDALVQFNELLLVKEDGASNLLSQKLREVRRMIYQTKNLSYFQRSVGTTILQRNTRKLRNTLYKTENVSQSLIEYIKSLHQDMVQLYLELDRSISLLHKETNALKEGLEYQNRFNRVLMKYLYNEDDYAYYRILFSALRERSKNYVDNPHMLLEIK